MPDLTACLRTHWLFPIVSPVLLSFLHKRPELGWLLPHLPQGDSILRTQQQQQQHDSDEDGKTDAPTTKTTSHPRSNSSEACNFRSHQRTQELQVLR